MNARARWPGLTRWVGGVLLGLTAFFLLASLGQLIWLQTTIAGEFGQVRDRSALTASLESEEFADRLSAAELRAAIDLEAEVLRRRYRQAGVLLMTRVWTRYLGFVTGMVLAGIGAAFVLGRVRAPSFEATVSQGELTAALKAASPGLVLSTSGVALMLTTILTHNAVETVDAAVYLRGRAAPRVPELRLDAPLESSIGPTSTGPTSTGPTSTGETP